MQSNPNLASAAKSASRPAMVSGGTPIRETTSSKPRLGARTLAVTSLALFAMFFGAGNLIYPVQIGVKSGAGALFAGLGFLATGALLPLFALVAVASCPGGLRALAARIGRVPGAAFSWVVFLSIGCFYGIPRTGAVAYEMSVAAAVGDSPTTLAAFTFGFFALTLALALNPNGILDRIGSWLTPLLLVLLAVLIGGAWWVLPAVEAPAAREYAQAPFLTGLLDGYNTMDAIGALVFGVVVIDSLRRLILRGSAVQSRSLPAAELGEVAGKNSGSGPEGSGSAGVLSASQNRYLFSRVAFTGAVAVGILALVYAGLVVLGSRIADPALGVTNGALGLAKAAQLVLGPAGMFTVGAIAILACLTTSVGLVGSCSEFFAEQLPRVSHRAWVLIIVAASFCMANLGLESLISAVVPVISFCYPLTMALVAVALLDLALPFGLRRAYPTTVGLAALGSLVDVCVQLGVMGDEYAGLLPGGAAGFAWVLPALLGLCVGVAWDFSARKR